MIETPQKSRRERGPFVLRGRIEAEDDRGAPRIERTRAGERVPAPRDPYVDLLDRLEHVEADVVVVGEAHHRASVAEAASAPGPAPATKSLGQAAGNQVLAQSGSGVRKSPSDEPRAG